MTNFPNNLDSFQRLSDETRAKPAHKDVHNSVAEALEAVQKFGGAIHVDTLPLTSEVGRVYILKQVDGIYMPGLYRCTSAEPLAYQSIGGVDLASVSGLEYENGLKVVSKLFGDGSDGDVIIEVDTTLSRDMYYNNLTINDEVTLNPNGFKIYVKRTLTFLGTGKIASNGGDAGNGTNAVSPSGPGSEVAGVGGLAGAPAHIGGTLPDSAPGVAGANGVTHTSYGLAGLTGISYNKAFITTLGSTGGAGGGTSGNPPSQGGAGGVPGATTRNRRSGNLILEFPFNFIDTGGDVIELIYPRCGSGSGGSGAAAFTTSSGNPAAASGGGGGSGGNGGFVFLIARNIITANGEVYIEAKGGNGGNAGESAVSGDDCAAGGSGGGAGGNGGLVIMMYETKTGTGTIDLSGGIGGNGTIARIKHGSASAGTAGETGKDGSIILIK